MICICKENPIVVFAEEYSLVEKTIGEIASFITKYQAGYWKSKYIEIRLYRHRNQSKIVQDSSLDLELRQTAIL